uniref:dolichyl-phosphate beta-glucosyltransferase n=1 Tax=Chromera velia CCMP2878 TaxID=1169474 RepID=A0A0G4F2L9_9ALVE|eukprot:Cvel_2662.t1-p1 / transcript=Cvel_2662.t1 / gene=Cvel_2662 / organism=Chromera_velia_CCMP2878 / gene_product=Dolichyl-phosphate beta-glucosyltransferase, putative / transcript_product=Dolichyl-phosphate beta-glucosyltransferase, putative / location=Cvel_scaffold106:37612-40130(+) / protein_length=392 / sequence_SO=supercontig / SO=protein_coding / is_pseudo=false
MWVEAVLIVFFLLCLLVALWWFTEPLRTWCDAYHSPVGSAVKVMSVEGDILECSSELFRNSKCDLSVVIPAYNESERLPLMCDDMLSYLTKKKKEKGGGLTWEVIVVDDGSKDDTFGVACRAAASASGVKAETKAGPPPSSPFKILRLKRNRGKGFAVRTGVHFASGSLILMADADGATKFEDLDRLLALCPEKVKKANSEKEKENRGNTESVDVVFGSRAHLAKESEAQRKWYRTILMWGFHGLVRLMVGGSVKDTQCGFKLFTRAAARCLFASVHESRWAFDIELLILAQSLGFRIGEVPVRWSEVPGSKINPAVASIQMARDMTLTRLMHLLGLWRPVLSVEEGRKESCTPPPVSRRSLEASPLGGTGSNRVGGLGVGEGGGFGMSRSN